MYMKEGKLATLCWKSKYKEKWGSSFLVSLNITNLFFIIFFCSFLPVQWDPWERSLYHTLFVGQLDSNYQYLISTTDPVILYGLLYLDGDIHKNTWCVYRRLFTAKKNDDNLMRTKSW